jgi:cell division protein FtsL
MENLQKQIEDMKKVMSEMQKEINRLSSQEKIKNERNYAQSQVFTDRITFRGEVYDKSGTKVIN